MRAHAGSQPMLGDRFCEREWYTTCSVLAKSLFCRIILDLGFQALLLSPIRISENVARRKEDRYSL
jgi:hypothetical protein